MEFSGHRNDNLYHAANLVSGIRSSRVEEGMTDSSHFEDHVEVHITNCPNLPGVEGLEELGGLKYLKINECPSLKRVDFRRRPSYKSSSSEDNANLPQPGHSPDSAGEDSAEESVWLDQLDQCVDLTQLMPQLGGVRNIRGVTLHKCGRWEAIMGQQFRRRPSYKSSSYEDNANLPQPGCSLNSAGEDSAEELFLLEQLDQCIEAYPEKKLL